MNGSKGSMKRLLTGLLAAALVTASFPSTVFAAGSSADPVPAVPEAVISDPAAPAEDPADGEDPVIAAEPEEPGVTDPADPAEPGAPADPDDVSEPDETGLPGAVTGDTDVDALSVDGAEEDLSVIPGDAPARDGPGRGRR